MKGKENLPMPGFCHRLLLWLPHLSLLFLAKATQSPETLSCAVVTSTLQGFLTPAYLICHVWSHCLIKRVARASFIVTRMIKT